MDINDIKEILKLVENSAFTSFSYRNGQEEIKLKKEPHEKVSAKMQRDQEPSEKEENDDLYILSPMVGTFYAASSPDSPPFVKAGDKVRAGQLVCVIEAMKLMNEINCEYDAKIVSVMVSNEQKVEYGQPLFKIEKI